MAIYCNESYVNALSLLSLSLITDAWPSSQGQTGG